ncbi:MAG: TRAM domain-containing protein [Jatrophihabitans sp.]
MAEHGPLLGHRVELLIGGPAHGGSCVARHEGRAVFVRHALPGETVIALVTEDAGGPFCFADAVEVLVASSDRVHAPCPYAGPGRCGGCDWQHVDAAAQRELKAEVIRDQFTRLAGLDVAGLLEKVVALPGGPLHWRSRNTYAVDRDGRPGMRVHRSHEVIPIEGCLLGTDSVGDAAALGATWPGLSGIEVARGDGPDVTVLSHSPGPGRQSRGRRPPDRVRLVSGPARLRYQALGRDFSVAAGSFWQVHPEAVEAFATALLDGLRPLPGESVLDLYAGSGALTASLAGAVGPTGRVLGLESSAVGVADAAGNLADLPQAEVRRGRVDEQVLAGLEMHPDVVVLDPPRAGAGRAVMQGLLGLGARAVGYVACDPAALARDVGTALGSGWRLVSLQAFDAFPMTHHVECVAVLEPDDTDRVRTTRVPGST